MLSKPTDIFMETLSGAREPVQARKLHICTNTVIEDKHLRLIFLLTYWGRDNVLGMETGYGFRCTVGARDFLFTKARPYWSWGPLILLRLLGSFPGGKVAGPWQWSPTFFLKPTLEQNRCIRSVYFCAFMAGYRDNLSFIYTQPPRHGFVLECFAFWRYFPLFISIVFSQHRVTCPCPEPYQAIPNKPFMYFSSLSLHATCCIHLLITLVFITE